MSREPYLSDPDVTLHHGDALDVLRTLPDGCVDMVATSPPFYGLRDYQVDGQIGLEETPDQWVDRLVQVFRECRRVLADHGTLWVEIGDSYASGGLGAGGTEKQASNAGANLPTAKKAPPGYKQKDLLGQPWMLAFALRADGWYLRSEIIWARPNPMPESVTDRPTKSHSTVFLLSKRKSYFYDADAIRQAYSDSNASRFAAIVRHGGDMTQGQAVVGSRDSGNPHAKQSDYRGLRGVGTNFGRYRLPPQEDDGRMTLDGSDGEAPRGPDGRRQTTVTKGDNSEQHRDGERWPNPSGANARSVWTIAGGAGEWVRLRPDLSEGDRIAVLDALRERGLLDGN